LQQLREGCLLGRRAGVLREAFTVQSPFVADADAVTVVAEAMRPLQGEWPAGVGKRAKSVMNWFSEDICKL